MRLHLFWLDKNWKKRGDCANNYNLIVDMENKTYMDLQEWSDEI